MTTVSPNPAERRLSAIMFTDIVGYSAMTQENEARALRLLAEHNALLRPIFTHHRGNEIKTIGDAFLVEFSSALDAVQCSIAIQSAIKERNDGCDTKEIFRIRIGVHLGDVVHEDGDVFGDGVNIASRIYPVASPGGICISAGVAQQVQNKIEHPIQKLPKHSLKNITLDIELFEIILPWIAGTAGTPLLSPLSIRRIRTGTLALAGIFFAVWLYTEFVSIDTYPMNRVAVLPLRNISQAAEHTYFAEGMTEELISSLSRISGLEVIARSSVIQYQDASLDFGLIGEKLRAGALVEGSVRHFGDSVRVTVRLVDASSERLIWDEDYNRPVANALQIQDDIALNVAGALRVQLLDAEKNDLLKKNEHHPDAWRLYLLGRYYLNKRTSENVMKSVTYFEQSRETDSLFAPAYAGLAESYLLIAGASYGSLPKETALTRAIEAADRSIELDSRLAEAFAVRGYIMYRLLWQWEDADSLFTRAIQLKPSYARAHEWYGLYLSLKGKTKKGLEQMKIAASLDPQSSSVSTGLGRLLSFDGQQQASIDHLVKVVREHPSYAEAYFALAMSEAHAKQYDAALRHYETALQLSGRREIILAEYGRTLGMAGRTQDAERIRAEFDSLVSVRPGLEWMLFLIHSGLGNYDISLSQMEKAFDDHEGLMAYIRTERLPDQITEHPRYKNLITKIWKEDGS